MRTLLWSYLGQRQFPREMSRFEIQHFITLTDADRRELRVRFPKKGRLGAALQLGFLRMTGTTLAAMDYVPRAVLKHLGTQLQCLPPEIATLRALYRVERTLYAHQSWACAWAGYRWPDRVDADAVIQILADGTAVTLDSARLAQQARARHSFSVIASFHVSAMLRIGSVRRFIESSSKIDNTSSEQSGKVFATAGCHNCCASDVRDR